MSECPHLGVGETDQPDYESIEHVLIIDNAVLALEDNVTDKVHKVALCEKLRKWSIKRLTTNI